MNNEVSIEKLDFMQRKVWVEINKKALSHNIKTVRSFLKSKTKLWAVVKSNAYGHGLALFSLLAEAKVDGFCVDSVIEGIKLREAGVKKHILVLGPTLFVDALEEATKNDITVTVGTVEALHAIAKCKQPPKFHIKVDTGMHRQGFYANDIPKVIQKIKDKKLKIKNSLTGIYTHFASAKDLNYPTFTDVQFSSLQKAIRMFEDAGFKNLMRHAAATGGTFIHQKYHLDAVRIGIGLYGYWPSKELEIQISNKTLLPVMTWRAIMSEVKNVPKGEYIGYDLVERASQGLKMAVIPIGYWHGFDRKLSKIGEVLVRGKRARVLGRVSMDIIVVDVTGISVKAGDIATIIGNGGSAMITAEEVGTRAGTVHYEIITRINPLIERIVV